ncbi:MAG: CBS domain-containing protein [Halobacteriaceae archaeon]
MDIADIATQEYLEVEAEDRLGKVRSIFEDKNPKAVIVTEAGSYEGIITQKQLLQSHIEDQTKAIAFAQPAPKISRTENIRDVARMLVEGNTKVGPVFEGESLWGIITDDAILEAVLDNLDALSVGDIYTEDPITIQEDETIGRIVNLMREHGISRLPVENENGYLTGVVTTHDIVDVVVRDMDKATTGDRAGEIERMLDLPAYDVMSSPVQTVTVNETVKTAVHQMLNNDYAGLVVTDPDDDRVIEGVITKTDVLRALSFTEEEHMDVQITNINLLESLSRQEIRKRIEQITDKYSKMAVHHCHVRFHKHKEKLRGTPLIRCQVRLRTNQGQVLGTGEGYGAENAFYVALDKLERNVLEIKGIKRDEEYRGQLLRKLREI